MVILPGVDVLLLLSLSRKLFVKVKEWRWDYWEAIRIAMVIPSSLLWMLWTIIRSKIHNDYLYQCNGALFRKRQLGWKDQRGRSMPESRAWHIILFFIDSWCRKDQFELCGRVLLRQLLEKLSSAALRKWANLPFKDSPPSQIFPFKKDFTPLSN